MPRITGPVLCVAAVSCLCLLIAWNALQAGDAQGKASSDRTLAMAQADIGSPKRRLKTQGPETSPAIRTTTGVTTKATTIPDIFHHYAPTEPKQIVIMFAYMRGGSSFAGSIFMSNPDIFYWYEPLWDIYNAMVASELMVFPRHVIYNRDGSPRYVTDYENNYIRKYLNRLFTCQVDKLPVEMLTSWTIVKPRFSLDMYKSCVQRKVKYMSYRTICQSGFAKRCPKYVGESLDRKCHVHFEMAANGSNIAISGFPPPKSYKLCSDNIKYSIAHCLPYLRAECQSRTIKAAKIIRARMDLMEKLIQDYPNLKVIHSLRDPRGTVLSRLKSSRSDTRTVNEEAKSLCDKMLWDIKYRKQLEQKYPNSFLEVKYEDLSDSPTDTVDRIYNFLGHQVPKEVTEWIQSSTHGTRDTGNFKEIRKNSSATAHAWPSKILPHIKAAIDSECAALYVEAGYQP